MEDILFLHKSYITEFSKKLCKLCIISHFFSYVETGWEKFNVLQMFLQDWESNPHICALSTCTLFPLMARWNWWETQTKKLPLKILKQWIRISTILPVPQTNWKNLKIKGRLWEFLASYFRISTILAFSPWNLMTMFISFFSVFSVFRMEDSGAVYHLWHLWRVLVWNGLRTFSSAKANSFEA